MSRALALDLTDAGADLVEEAQGASTPKSSSAESIASSNVADALADTMALVHASNRARSSTGTPR